MTDITRRLTRGGSGKYIIGIEKMKQYILCALSLLMLCVLPAYADATIPKFADFPAKIYQGKNAAVRINSAKDRKFESHLRQLSGLKPNFAGHYTLATWGCGASCLMIGAIDAETGRTTWFPFTVCCWDVDLGESIQFKPDSRLIEIQGSRNESGGGIYYYALVKNTFVLVKAIEKGRK